MRLPFTKMHGIGNDYVYVNAFEVKVDDPARVARLVSPRRTGIGSDGLILIAPSQTADCRMEMYNADGSRGEMCGNGIRCVGKFVYERGIARKPELRVETDAGVKSLVLEVSGDRHRRHGAARAHAGADSGRARRMARIEERPAARRRTSRGGGSNRQGDVRLDGQSALRPVRSVHA
jgi:diaminopimelate epimerase